MKTTVIEDSFFVVPQSQCIKKPRPNTINTRPSRRPSVQLETDRPGVEATLVAARVRRELQALLMQ